MLEQGWGRDQCRVPPSWGLTADSQSNNNNNNGTRFSCVQAKSQARGAKMDPPPRPAFPRAVISSYSERSHWTVVLAPASAGPGLNNNILGQPMRKYDFRLSRQSLSGPSIPIWKQALCAFPKQNPHRRPLGTNHPLLRKPVYHLPPVDYALIQTRFRPIPPSAIRPSLSLLLQHQDPRGQRSLYSGGGGLGVRLQQDAYSRRYPDVGSR